VKVYAKELAILYAVKYYYLHIYVMTYTMKIILLALVAEKCL